MTNLAVEIGRCARAALRAPRRRFCLINGSQSFPNAVVAWHGLRVITPCLGRGVTATIVESCCVLLFLFPMSPLRLWSRLRNCVKIPL